MKKADAIEFFGSATNVAAVLGLHKSAVSQWGEDVPELRAYQLQQIMDGQNSTHTQNSDTPHTDQTTPTNEAQGETDSGLTIPPAIEVAE